ncbi:MAG TPA: hemin uptake protein HemP [Candidatus Eisenbacteria bacterium]|nr:hemin uptake protein HemP [Candidatus Eisenbacteria bacterium]
MKELPVHLVSKQAEPRLAPASAKKPRIESRQLFQGNNEVIIVHQDEEYNLRITRNGKLILTK